MHSDQDFSENNVAFERCLNARSTSAQNVALALAPASDSRGNRAYGCLMNCRGSLSLHSSPSYSNRLATRDAERTSERRAPVPLPIPLPMRAHAGQYVVPCTNVRLFFFLSEKCWMLCRSMLQHRKKKSQSIYS